MPRGAPRIVDHQAHWYPRAYLETRLDRPEYPRTRFVGGDIEFSSCPGEASLLSARYTDLDRHLDDMDAHGIDVAVISPNLVGEVSRLPAAEAVEALDLLHREYGRAQREHPERLVGLAMLPMQDAQAALRVLDDAILTHELRGVCILSNVAGQPIVRDDLMPVYRRIEKLGMPLFLHPSHISVARASVLNVTVEIGLAWMFDTAAAALALIYGGVLDACPRLVVVHPHLGGVLPYVTGRVSQCEYGIELEHDLATYLRTRFYVDSVQANPPALGIAADTYGADRIVFGTDFPWLDRADARVFVEANLDADMCDRVLHRNAVPGLRLPAAGYVAG